MKKQIKLQQRFLKNKKAGRRKTNMADITASMVAELRTTTGAGMMDCKKALVECGGDMQKAVDFLREKGIAKAAKKAERTASQGKMFSYIHSNAKLGVLLELDCETDFVANTDEFMALGHEIAMQIAAANPTYIKPEDVPADVIEHETEVIKAQAREEKKPEKMLDKIAEGRIQKFYEENCLMNQKYIRDPNVVIKDMIIENIAKMGENIQIRRFARFAIEA
jgi:elongation factor Ts